MNVPGCRKSLRPQEHRALLNSLHLSFQCGNFAFVRAGIRPGIPIAEQNVRYSLWIRQEFLNFSNSWSSHLYFAATRPFERRTCGRIARTLIPALLLQAFDLRRYRKLQNLVSPNVRTPSTERGFAGRHNE